LRQHGTGTVGKARQRFFIYRIIHFSLPPQELSGSSPAAYSPVGQKRLISAPNTVIPDVFCGAALPSYSFRALLIWRLAVQQPRMLTICH
ncbi:MAG: hypothetical protein K6B74_07945, partial [Ruminococcus sp.]|nr:hypothetical protein [Ruminococcus sp.]